MLKRKFKTFETIAKFKKLYEANEMEQDPNGGEMTDPAVAPEESATDTPDATNPPSEGTTGDEGDATSDPNKQADPESGTFMSDNQKAEMAKMILDALMMTPPEPGTIPSNLMNVTTDNADEVIKYVQGLNALSAPLSLDNDADTSSMAGALKGL